MAMDSKFFDKYVHDGKTLTRHNAIPNRRINDKTMGLQKQTLRNGKDGMSALLKCLQEVESCLIIALI